METKKRILYFQNKKPLIPFAEACLSLTPKVAVHNSQELFLDIAPTEKLFGGEEKLLAATQDLASSFGIEGGFVLTDRPEWARAFSGSPQERIPQGLSQKHLYELDIARLQECGDPFTIEKELPERKELVAFMKRVGMRTIYDFIRLNPMAISRRFGKMGVVLQEWVSGKREVLFPPFVPEEVITERIDAEEVFSLEQLLLYLQAPLSRIEARLRARALMAKQLRVVFSLESHPKLIKTLLLSEPQREADGVLKLLKEFLDNTSWESPLESLEIMVSETSPYSPGQLSLLEDSENLFFDLSQYVSRLRARYGDTSVGTPSLEESYLPELAWKAEWPPSQGKGDEKNYPISTRPHFLYQPPRAFHPTPDWTLVPSENLATEWWKEGGFRRYFIAHDPQGTKLWIFWDCHKQKWFLHGTFD